jgi:hypothetical protein
MKVHHDTFLPPCQAREASRHPQRSNGTATSSIGGTSFGDHHSTGGSLYGGSQHGSHHGSPVSTPRLGHDAGGSTGSMHVQPFVVRLAPAACLRAHFRLTPACVNLLPCTSKGVHTTLQNLQHCMPHLCVLVYPNVEAATVSLLGLNC